MPRSTRSARLETRTNRLKLPLGTRHWVTVGKGIALGYRRGAHGGTWYMRRALPGNRYTIESIGLADDHRDADQAAVFDYFGAQEIVRQKAGEVARAHVKYTVGEAARDYIAYVKGARKSGYTVEKTINAHILPTFEHRTVESLTKDDIEKWHRALALAPRRMRGKGQPKLVPLDDDPETIRRRRTTANRILGVFKALLNRAKRNKGLAASPWDDVEPFRGVNDSRKIFLQEAQCRRLINVCRGRFREYVQALLYTGARPGKELEHIRVQDFDAEAGTIRIPDGKTGPRDVYLTNEGVRFFARLAAGRKPDEFLLLKDDGTTWGKNHWARPFKRAVQAAKLPAGTNAYALRHSYVSLALKNGMNLQVLAESCGTSIRMIEEHYAKFVHADRRRMFNKALPSFGFKDDRKVRAVR